MVAIIRTYDPQVVEERSPVVPVTAPRTAAGGLGEAMQDFGQAAWSVEESIATAHAYQVDADWANFLRETMRGNGEEGTGYLNTRYGDAVNGRESVIEQVQARYSELVESINPLVRPGAVRSMESSYQTFLSQVNSHAEAQARAAASAGAASRRAALQEMEREYAIAGLTGDSEMMAHLDAAIAEEVEAMGHTPGTPEFDRARRAIVEAGTLALIEGVYNEQGPQAARDIATERMDSLGTQAITQLEPIFTAATEADGADAADAAFGVVIEEAQAAGNEEIIVGGDQGNPQGSPYNTPLSGAMTEEDAAIWSDVTSFEQAPGLSRGLGETAARLLRGANEAYAPPANPAFFADRPQAVPSPIGGGNVGYLIPPRYVAPDFSAAREQLMQIENPRARQAALTRLDELMEAHEVQMEQVHSQAMQQAQAFIQQRGGQVGSVEALPFEVRQYLTPTDIQALRTFAATERSGTDPETPLDLTYSLYQAYEAGDTREVERLVNANLGNMSQSDREAWAQRAAEMRAGTDALFDQVEQTMVRRTVTTALNAYGIPTSGADANPSASRLLWTAVNRWIERQIAQNEEIPNEAEIQARAYSLAATQVSIREGWNYRGPAFGVDISGLTSAERDDLTMDRLVAAARDSQLAINGVEISLDELNRVRAIISEPLGREANIEEVWAALIEATMGGR